MDDHQLPYRSSEARVKESGRNQVVREVVRNYHDAFELETPSSFRSEQSDTPTTLDPSISVTWCLIPTLPGEPFLDQAEMPVFCDDGHQPVAELVEQFFRSVGYLIEKGSSAFGLDDHRLGTFLDGTVAPFRGR